MRPDLLRALRASSTYGLAAALSLILYQPAGAAWTSASRPADAEEAIASPAGEQDTQPRRRRPEGDSTAKPRSEGDRAVPREQPRAKPKSPPREPSPHRQPDRSGLPHRYFAVPRAYYFPPVDLRASFYYHPYFGFYYGPYYGPFYPYPGPFDHRVRYTVGALHIKVKPADAQVYLNGYYAGIAEDFDGVFQRLYVPAGEHQLEFHLEGYDSFRRSVYVAAGDTLDVRHQMVRLPPGRSTPRPPRPRSVPDEWMAPDGTLESETPASPYGMLAIRTDPIDAQIVIDGDAWEPAAGQRELVIHLPAGWHTLEVRKDGHRTFTTNVELSEGQTTRLRVTLER